MKKHLCNLTLLLALGSGLALSQTMPRQQPPNQTPPTLPSDNQPATRPTHVPPANPTAVQNDIQSAIQKDPTLANANINVQVTDKDVELTGTVPSKDAKHTAQQIAKDHAAGLDVKNHIKVEKGPGAGNQANPKDHTSDK